MIKLRNHLNYSLYYDRTQRANQENRKLSD